MQHEDDFIQSFVEEARVHVDTVETQLLQANLNQISEEAINNIFRAVHSIKGTSGFLDLSNIVKLSHMMENTFGEIRSGKMKLAPEMIDILLVANDCMKVMVEDVGNSEKVDISSSLEQLSAILSGTLETKRIEETPSSSINNVLGYETEQKIKKLREGVEQGQHIYRIQKKLEPKTIKLMQEIASMGTIIDATMNLNALPTPMLDILFTSVLEKDLMVMALKMKDEELCELTLHEELEKPEKIEKIEKIEKHDKPEASNLDSTPNKGQTQVPEDSLRVNVLLLNDLLNLSSEMVLVKNQLLRSIESHRKSIPGIEGIFQNINHITNNLQEKIMQTRMQPISNVFNKFPRIIRELSKKLGKEIHLELEGTEVELDKSIIEALGDPMTHLVRNAVDHGLETPDEREKLGKKREGTVILKAYHEGGYVNIDVIDNGKGIDVEVIKRNALSKGFIDKNELTVMGEQEILKLLFKPGFSTADAVTDISGRGVGMDVVKTNIEKLGGTIEIFTVPKVGTTFRLLLPLTLAIIPSLIVVAENQKFALPQVNLQEIVRIKANDPAKRIEYINHAEVLRLRDKLLPIVHLADVLGLQRTFIDPKTGKKVVEKRKTLFHIKRGSDAATQDIVVSGDERRALNEANIVRILVIKIGSRRMGLAVDSILGSEEILVKTLPVHIKECQCYSGVTILGDGKTSMILDPTGIIEKANLHFLEGMEDKKQSDQALQEESMRETQSLLLFQCSGPETLALDMSLVSRVEEILPSNIEKIGDKEYIKYRGETLRVIRPEDFIPISNHRNENNKLFVIIPKLVSHPMGILIEKINDTMQAGVNIKQDENLAAKGLFGSAILNQKIILMLNIYELFELANPEYYKVETTIKKGVKTTILLAEDTPFFQKIERSYLEDAGYQVIVAENGKRAFEILQTEQIDAIASDINMPIMNGLELIKKIRQSPEHKHLPAVAITSLTSTSQIEEGLKAGFDAYEFKLDRQKLLKVLDEVISKRRVK